MMNEAPMSRRRALKQGVAMLLGVGCVAAAAAAVTGQKRPRRVSVWEADTFPFDVDYVTLNGSRIEHVVECNEASGWLCRLARVTELASGRSSLRKQWLRGDVRIYWKAPA